MTDLSCQETCALSNSAVEFESQALEQILAPSREQIMRLEAEMRKFEAVDLPLAHNFAPGTYARTCFLPKGSLIVGKIHKHAHQNIVSQGRVTVVTEFGHMEIQGPFVFTSQPGTKRALYVHEDTYWTTIHLTEETDLSKIEDEIIAKDYDELPQTIVAECITLLESTHVIDEKPQDNQVLK